jgi:soluble lytic murein transglycosylase-like protein
MTGLVGFFRRYGEQYGFDYLVIAAQGYQESALNQSERSKAGAVGVMQMKPSTAQYRWCSSYYGSNTATAWPEDLTDSLPE